MPSRKRTSSPTLRSRRRSPSDRRARRCNVEMRSTTEGRLNCNDGVRAIRRYDERKGRNVPESGRRRRRCGRGVGEEEEGAGPGDVREVGVVRSHAADEPAKEEERSPGVGGRGVARAGIFEKFRWCGPEADR